MSAIISAPGLAQNSSKDLEKPAGYTLKVDPSENRGTWEGWGTSLTWWANMVGGKNYEKLYADLFFTSETVPFLGQKLPGLHLNIVRYNIGGGGRGRNDFFKDIAERKPDILPWVRDIAGYWISPSDKNPASDSWDWSRDAAQRSVMHEAIARGVNQVEFFANAPMWWMMDSNSSAGGRLCEASQSDFAFYLAAVVEQAEKNWDIKVDYLSPFNEPSAGWWGYPKNQEGADISREEQAKILALLRAKLDKRGLKKIGITASDENSMQGAYETHEFFKSHPVQIDGQPIKTVDLIDKVNVHSYSGLEPMRDNGAREQLRASVGKTRLWADEFGDIDGSGIVLAQSIMEDINYLRPTAWIYWQALDSASPWGLVNCRHAETADDPESGNPTLIYTKYYVFAQFTRFLRPHVQILGSDDNNSVVAYNKQKSELTFVTVNYHSAKPIVYDLGNLRAIGGTAEVTETHTDGSKAFSTSKIAISDKKLVIEAAPNTIYSIVLSDVKI